MLTCKMFTVTRQKYNYMMEEKAALSTKMRMSNEKSSFSPPVYAPLSAVSFIHDHRVELLLQRTKAAS